MKIAYAACLFLVLASCLGCGASGSAHPLAGPPATSSDAPAGVDPVLWQRLKAELDRVLANRKISAMPPTGSGNSTPDFAVNDASGTPQASWSYRNQGDYNLDGVVNVSDLTPLGINFGKTSASPDWLSAQTADGNSDGVINIADVAPIGIAFGARLDAWQIQQKANTPGAPWTIFVQLVAYAPSNPQYGYPLMQASLPAVTFGDSYRVVPFYNNAGTFVFGQPSNEFVYGWVGIGSWPMDGANRFRTHAAPLGGPDAMDVEWQTVLDGRVDYGQAIVDDYGAVYAGTYSPSGAGGTLYALKRDGGVRWHFPTAAGIHTSPALNPLGGYAWIEVCDLAGNLYCLAADGKMRWRTALGAQSDRTSPLIDLDGNLYISLRNPGKLVKVDPSGAVLWDIPVAPTVTGICMDYPAGLIYLLDGNLALNVFNPDGTLSSQSAVGLYSRGELLWRDTRIVFTSADTGDVHFLSDGVNFPLQYSTGGFFQNSPAYNPQSGTTFVGTYDPPTDTGDLFALDSNAQKLWSVPLPQTVYSDIAVSSADWLYFSAQGNGVLGVYAIDPAHSISWFYNTSPGRATGPAVCGGGRLVFAVDTAGGDSSKCAVVSIYTPGIS